jgi:hypothetical protein
MLSQYLQLLGYKQYAIRNVCVAICMIYLDTNLHMYVYSWFFSYISTRLKTKENVHTVAGHVVVLHPIKYFPRQMCIFIQGWLPYITPGPYTRIKCDWYRSHLTSSRLSHAVIIYCRELEITARVASNIITSIRSVETIVQVPKLSLKLCLSVCGVLCVIYRDLLTKTCSCFKSSYTS